MTPLISIIVPVYNCENTVGRCLESILAQTQPSLEIIVVDDGSIDNSLQVIKSYSAIDTRIKVMEQVNTGVSSARNKALEASSGEWIAFVDADDYLDKEYLHTLYTALCKYKADISLCSYIKETEDGDQIFEEQKSSGNKPLSFSIKKGYSYISGTAREVVWGALYKKELIKNIRFASDLYVSEDTLFFAEAAKRSRLIVRTDKALYHYIIYPSSASHGMFTPKKYTQLEAWERVTNLFKDHPEIYCSAKCKYAIYCYHMIKNHFYNPSFKKNYYKETLKKYRKNLKWFYISKETSLSRKIFRTLFAICPHLFLLKPLLKTEGSQR